MAENFETTLKPKLRGLKEGVIQAIKGVSTLPNLLTPFSRLFLTAPKLHIDIFSCKNNLIILYIDDKESKSCKYCKAEKN